MKRLILLLVISLLFLAPKPVKKKYIPKNPENLIGEWEVFQVRELTCDCDEDFTPEKAFGFIVEHPGTLLGRKLNVGNYSSVFHLEKVQNINKMFTDFSCGFYNKEPEKVKIGAGEYSSIGKFIDRLNKGDFARTESISDKKVFGRKFREIVKFNQSFVVYDILDSNEQKEKTCDSPHKTIGLFKNTVMVTVVGNTILFLQRVHPDEVGPRKKAMEDPFKKKKTPIAEDPEDEEEETPSKKLIPAKKEVSSKKVHKKEDFQLDDEDEDEDDEEVVPPKKKLPEKKEISKKTIPKKKSTKAEDDSDIEETPPAKKTPPKKEATKKTTPPKKEPPKKEEFLMDDDDEEEDDD